MTRRKLLPSLLVLVAVSGLFLVAQSVYAQVVTLKGKGKPVEVFLNGFDVPADTTMLVQNNNVPYVVPEGRSLVITDLVVSNLGTGTDTLFEVEGQLQNFVVPPGTLVMNFQTGLDFAAGDNISVKTTNGGVSFTMRGILTKP